MKIKNYKFRNLIYAGTFDNFHIGHKKMLDLAFKLAEKVSIGITTEKLYKTKPLTKLIPTGAVRRRLVEQYLRERNWLKRAKFFRLDDIFGSSITDSTLDSILVTKLTKPNADRINGVRVMRGMRELKIIVAPLVRGDDGEVVTSERIRMGEIDREGNKYQISQIKNQKYLKLPKYLREELRKPLGKVIRGREDRLEEAARKVLQLIIKLKHAVVISVGDIVTMSLLKIDFDPDVKIIDLRSRRQEIEDYRGLIADLRGYPPKSAKNLWKSKSRLINRPGTINFQAVEVIKKSFHNFLNNQKKQLIIIKGEEDLLTLPAILLAPLNSIVLYGQWNMGVVAVKVTEEKKKLIGQILKKFD